MSENQQQYKALALFSLLALTPSSFVISSYTITSTAVNAIKRSTLSEPLLFPGVQELKLRRRQLGQITWRHVA